jgi:uncharacterized protein (TIGR02996 family)
MSFHDHPEWRSLLRGICAYPDEDLRRLVAADWLTENGEDGYAEFIRLQVEFARDGDPDLVARIRQLFQAGYSDWFGRSPFKDLSLWKPSSSNPTLVISRGFGSEGHAPLNWFIGGRCERCEGRGHLDLYSCPSCYLTGSVGLLPGRLDDLVLQQPISRLAVTDKEPGEVRYPEGRRQYGWLWPDFSYPGAEREQHSLPIAVLERMRTPMGMLLFSTPEEANEVLSRTLLNTSREKADLPPLHRGR